MQKLTPMAPGTEALNNFGSGAVIANRLQPHVGLSIVILLLVVIISGCGKNEAKRLPDSAFKVSFETPKVPAEIAAGAQTIVQVGFRNMSDVTWPSKPNSKNRNAVHFAYHWISEKGDVVVYDGERTVLPQDVKPGDSVALKAIVQAPQRTGKYILEMTLVQEGVAWFPDKGGDRISVPVRIVESVSASARDNEPKPETDISSLANTNEVSGEPASRAGAARPEVKSPSQAMNQQAPAAKAHAVQNPSENRTTLWSVQVASLGQRNESEKLARDLKDKGYDAYVAVAEIKGKQWYQVHVGRLSTRAEAEKLRETLRSAEKLDRAFIAHKG
jgi:cell division septation protein DedD